MTISVYLAGPIQHAQDRGKGWRTRLSEKYDDSDIEFVDPMDKYDPTDSDGFDDWQSEDAEWTDERIVSADRALIDECDAMLIHYEKVPTWGSPREHEYATANDIPVFVQTTEERPSPWLTVDAEAVAETFETAIEAIRTHFGVMHR